jgi:acetoin utilization deacetylase AcuC-like enzyme
MQKIITTIVKSPQHAFPGHPENPQRFRGFDRLFQGQLGEALTLVETRFDVASTLESVRLAHREAYITAIQDAMATAPRFLDYGDTYATPYSYSCALDAVAGTLAVLEPIQRGVSKHAFALIRPPGHHANQSQAMGFCLFNNVAVATKSLQIGGYAKILVYDFDVHHGNGTQDIFASDPDVLYISSHQSGIYPGTGHQTEVGKAAGEGSVMNIPLPAYTGDMGFERIFEQVIEPATDRFQPNFMLISAGFDAHWSDPLANLQLSTSGFATMAHRLIQLAQLHCEGRLAFVLEGGYDPDALVDNVQAVLHALAKLEQPGDRLGAAPIDEPDISHLLREVRAIHNL